MTAPYRINVRAAHALYVGPPTMTLRAVGERFGCSETVLRRRFALCHLPVRGSSRPKRVEVPPQDEPVLADVLTLIRDSDLSWTRLEARAGLGTDTLRALFMRDHVNPFFKTVSAVAQALGYRLALVPIDGTGSGGY